MDIWQWVIAGLVVFALAQGWETLLLGGLGLYGANQQANQQAGMSKEYIDLMRQQMGYTQEAMNRVWPYQQQLLNQMSSLSSTMAPNYQRMGQIAQYRLGVPSSTGGAAAPQAGQTTPTQPTGQATSYLNWPGMLSAPSSLPQNRLHDFYVHGGEAGLQGGHIQEFLQAAQRGTGTAIPVMQGGQRYNVFRPGAGTMGSSTDVGQAIYDALAAAYAQQPAPAPMPTAPPQGSLTAEDVPWYLQMQQPGFTDPQRAAMTQMADISMAQQKKAIEDRISADMARRGLSASSLGASQSAGLENWLATAKAKESANLSLAEMARIDQQRATELANTMALLGPAQQQEQSMYPLLNPAPYANVTANMAGQMGGLGAQYAGMAGQANQNFYNQLYQMGQNWGWGGGGGAPNVSGTPNSPWFNPVPQEEYRPR